MALTTKDLARKYNSAVFPNMQGGPMEHSIAAKAVAFKEALQPEFKSYAQAVAANAKALAETLKEQGLDIVSGGTDNHLFLVDLISRDFTGKDAEEALGRAHITVNKNTVPGEPRSPFVTSGLRLGTAAVTTRGFSRADCAELAGIICDVLDQVGNAEAESKARDAATRLCRRHPVYVGR